MKLTWRRHPNYGHPHKRGDQVVGGGTFEATLLIVAHSGPLRALILDLLGLPLTSFWQLHLSAASLSVVEVHPVGSVLELLNDTSHYRRKP